MTSDVGKVLAQSHGAKVGGEASLSAGLQVAASGAQAPAEQEPAAARSSSSWARPITEEEKDLVKLGKKLKKNSVAVDIVNFGEESREHPQARGAAQRCELG